MSEHEVPKEHRHDHGVQIFDDIVGIWRECHLPDKVESQSDNYSLAVEAFLKTVSEECDPERRQFWPNNFRAIWSRDGKNYVVAELTLYPRGHEVETNEEDDPTEATVKEEEPPKDNGTE